MNAQHKRPGAPSSWWLAILLAPVLASAQTVVFQEDFENNANNGTNGAQAFTAAGGATPYVGTTPAGQSYTASPAWIDGANCNGVVLSANNSTLPAWADGGGTNTGNRCNSSVGGQSYGGLRTLSRGLGAEFGGGDNNHAVSAYTECPGGVCSTIPSGPVNGVMFRTNALIAVTSRRFYTFSVAAAATGCGTPGGAVPQSGDPQYQFQLIDGANTRVPIGGPLNVCGPGVTSRTVANLKTAPFSPTTTVYLNTLRTTSAIAYTQSTLGVEMYSVSGVTLGNDGAFDNIQVIDVSPRISKGFTPSTVSTGATSTMTFTVLNTTDGLAKSGWAFTETLPAGLTLAGTTVGGTCTAVTHNAVAGAGTIRIGGNLPAGPSCTVTVQVRVAPATVPGTVLQNCPANFSALEFIDAPTACADLNVVAATQIVVVEQSLPQDAQDFAYATSGAGLAAFALDDDGDAALPNTRLFTGLAAGSYTVTQGAVAGWLLSDLQCSDPGGNSAVNIGARTATINLTTGETVTCTFTNARQPIIRLQKALPSGRAAAGDQFALRIAGTGGPVNLTTTGSGSTATGVATLNPATANAAYTLSETAAGGASLANYATSFSCTNALPGGQVPSGTGASASLTPVAGDDLTCTFTNAVQGADLGIVKTGGAASARAGSVVTFTLAGTNNGPAAANGAVIRDVPGTGLDCTAPGPNASCSASGGAACPGATVPVASLQGPAGVSIPTLPAGGSFVITLQCLVTATGQP